MENDQAVTKTRGPTEDHWAAIYVLVTFPALVWRKKKEISVQGQRNIFISILFCQLWNIQKKHLTESHSGEIFSFHNIEIVPQAKSTMMPRLFCKSCLGKHYQSENAEPSVSQKARYLVLLIKDTISIVLPFNSTSSNNMLWGNLGLDAGETKTIQILLSLK